MDYDNSAFYYFMLTILGFYLAPSILYILYRVVGAVLSSATKSKKLNELVRSDAEKEKAKEIVEKNSGFKTLWTVGFIVNFILTLLGLAVCYYLILLVWDDHEIASFDPYQILGIDQGSTDKVIKKAYRMLSLKYHPDKNPGNKQAEEIFMKVAKAYEALTDETAKENWEKYGNPDGKQALEVSIGLPTFLLEKDNQNTILVIYLLLLVVVIPVLTGLYYARSKQYGEKNVMYDTYAFFNHMLNENLLVKQLPEVYAGASEFHKRNAPKKNPSTVDREAFTELHKQMKDVQMHKPKYDNIPIVYTGNVLLHAHLNQLPISSPSLRADLSYMLSRSPELIDALVELASSHHWLNTTLRIIEFSQYLTQGLFTKDSPFMQLPHVGAQEIKAIMTSKGAVKGKTLPAFLDTPDEEKRGLSRLTDSQKKDVLDVCRLMPNIEVNVDVFVEDEEEIAENDLVTVKLTATRKNVSEGKNTPPVYAPKYPDVLKESWHAILANRDQKIICLEKVTDQGRTFTAELRFMVQRQGQYAYEVHLKSDNYVGLDQIFPVKFTVLPASTRPAYVPHPDDVELDNEPTLFEQVMAANVEQDTDTEDEEDEPAKKTVQAKAAVKTASSKTGKDSEEEESSEED